MLEADRHALSSSVYHQALGIKEKELSNLLDYLTTLGVTAGFLFGFGSSSFFSGLPDNTPKILTLIYYVCAMMCMGALFYCIATSTLCTILAPTIALNGPRGSVHKAVAGMYEEREHIWRAFAVGCAAFCLNFFAFIWVLLTRTGNGPEYTGIAVLCSLIFIVGAVVTISGVRRLFSRFHYKDDTSESKKNGPEPAEQVSGLEYLKSQSAAALLSENQVRKVDKRQKI